MCVHYYTLAKSLSLSNDIYSYTNVIISEYLKWVLQPGKQVNFQILISCQKETTDNLGHTRPCATSVQTAKLSNQQSNRTKEKVSLDQDALRQWV